MTTAKDDEMREAAARIVYDEMPDIDKHGDPIPWRKEEPESHNEWRCTCAADAILSELRRRGAWLPGDPVTDEMVTAAGMAASHTMSAGPDGRALITDIMHAAITAALNARAKA